MTVRLLSIGYARPPQAMEIKVGRELTPYEAEFYKTACTHLWEYHRLRDLLLIVEDNERAVAASIQRFVSAAEQSLSTRPAKHEEEIRLINASVVNYLGSARLYLDHRRTRLSRRYGTSSGELAAFDTKRREVFDREPLYRFVYKYRNYVQHCGLPLSSIPHSGEIVETATGETTVHHVSVGCSRDRLLAEYDEWDKAEPFLRDQSEHFEILPILARFTQLLWEIEEATIRAEVPMLWAYARGVGKVLAEGCDESHSAEVADVVYAADKTFDGAKLNFIHAPLSVLQAFKMIRRLDGVPSWTVRPEILAIDQPPTVLS